MNVRLNKETRQRYSDAIDRMQEGLDAMIDLYNEAADDIPLIAFEERVVEDIEKAKKKYGEAFINHKINTIVKEVLSFMDLEDEK